MVITIAHKTVLGDDSINDLRTIQLKFQFNRLSLPKELVVNTIFIVHLQSTLMTMASERDFPFNVSSDYKLNYIHYPQSYRTTLIQISSRMHKIFSDVNTSMYRIQLSVKRIPNSIKTILRLLTAGSPMMIKKMLPTSFNNIVRTINENLILMNTTRDQLNNLWNFLNEIKQLSIDITPKFSIKSSNKTDLILHNGFDSKNVLEKIDLIIQKMKKQFEQIIQLFTNLGIKATVDLSVNNETIHLLPILYAIENNAYFLYQLSSIYTDVLDRFVLDRTAGMARYVLLSTDEERLTCLSNLSNQLSNTLHVIEQLFIERQNEYEANNIKLQQAYEKLSDEFQDRSVMSKLL